MKKILALLCLCTVVGATMSASVTGTRICLSHVYEWQDAASGMVTVSEGDPYYIGGWSVSIVEAEAGTVTVEGGLTPHGVAQPLLVNNGVVTLPVNEDTPVATVTKTSRIEGGGMMMVVDSVINYYVVNEAWWADGAEMADIQGELLADGSIHIPGGFAYYIETIITTTITENDGTTRTYTDEKDDMSPVYRDTWLLMANGKHEFVNEADGTTSVVDVNIRQSGDTVWVTNLYGYGAPEVYMVLNADGTMAYASQMLRDIPAEMSPNGSGVWTNNAITGAVTTTAITWGQTTPSDGVQTWSGWNNNRLYYTDGTQFVIPGEEQGMRGDVNKDGNINVGDVTALISHVLSGDFTESDTFSPENANTNFDSSITIADVTLLINYVLSGVWSM